jgi:hypothetical protein
LLSDNELEEELSLLEDSDDSLEELRLDSDELDKLDSLEEERLDSDELDKLDSLEEDSLTDKEELEDEEELLSSSFFQSNIILFP